jgi:hypothetical protein
MPGRGEDAPHLALVEINEGVAQGAQQQRGITTSVTEAAEGHHQLAPNSTDRHDDQP